MLRATCSADVHRCRPDSNNIKDTRVFEGSRRTTYRDQKNLCSRQKLHPRVTFDAPKPDTRNSVQQRRRKKHDQREILESRDIRQVPTKRRVEVQSQNRDLLIRDVCTCLAHWRTPPGQGGREILARGEWTSLRSCSSCSNSPSRTCSSPRFSSLDRVLDIPVMPQKGDATVQSLIKVVAVVVYDSCPWSRRAAVLFTDMVVDIPVRGQPRRCLRFSNRQSSMTILRRNGCFFGACCAIFSDSPERGGVPGVVVEGSLGWRGRRESDSQVTCHMFFSPRTHCVADVM